MALFSSFGERSLFTVDENMQVRLFLFSKVARDSWVHTSSSVMFMCVCVCLYAVSHKCLNRIFQINAKFVSARV